MGDIRHIHLQCDCHTPDHIVRVTLTTWKGEDPDICVQPFLNPNYSFFRRIWLALKFVFLSRRRPDSHWGSFHYDSVTLDEKQVNDLSSMIVHYKLIKKLRDRNRKGKQIGDCTRFEPERGVKTLGSSTLSLSATKSHESK